MLLEVNDEGQSGGFGNAAISTFTRGSKLFELSDHRSNSMVTVTDRRQQVSADNTTVSYYVADILTAQDYSSFGSLLQGRQFGSTPRYTYNGKQLDTETGWQDYGMRAYLVDVPIFGSVDPLTKKYAWYSPYQFAGNDVIRNSDIDGKEPWLRSSIETISNARSAITAVSATYTMEEGGILSLSRGMAVDPDGNVLIFNQKGGLAALQFGISSNAGLSASLNYTWYNNKLTSLDQLLGTGSSGGISTGWKDVVTASQTDEYNNGEKIGTTVSLGLGFSALPVGASYQKTKTTGLLLTGVEYDRIYNLKKAAESQALNDELDYDYKQAQIAGSDNNPNYAKALFMSQVSDVNVNYEPVQGQKNTYEIMYKYDLHIKANQLSNPYGKDASISKTFTTGVQVRKDASGNYVSTNYNPKK